MSKVWLAIVSAVAGAALTWTASTLYAQTDTMPADHGNMPGMAAGGSGSPSTAGYKAAMDAMMKAMMGDLTGDPDRDFAQQMIPHHQSAVDMAKVELEHGKDPQLRQLAQEIMAAQEKEIAIFQGWLAARP